MSLGPLMLDIQGLSLSEEDRHLLAHPQVGGLILFTRNYESPSQLRQLIAEIRQVRPEIIIAVDHEGGRVQRFREGFTPIPAMRCFGNIYVTNPTLACDLAKKTGWLIGAELLAEGIDLSFTPVLDVDHGVSQVIGDRAFSDSTEVIVELNRAFISGLHEAGMVATGKHFPGHGSVSADSHVAIPVDGRELAEIRDLDLVPFKQLSGHLDAVMPAHVIYEQVDDQPAGFSTYWLQDVLRGELGFEGVIFSDDLSMEGATVAGTFAQRTQAALDAGCDMVLVCNNRTAALEVLDYLEERQMKGSPRLESLRGKGALTPEALQSNKQYLSAKQALKALQWVLRFDHA